RGSRYQVYVLVYDSRDTRVSANGEMFATELRWLRDRVIGPKKDLTIVGHSMGAIVSRHALNVLTRDHADGIDRFGKVRLVAVDPPMHGYPGLGDHGFLGALNGIFSGVVPAGYMDMRAESDFFRGNHKGVRGVMDQPLPGNVRFEPVFAQSGDTALDYTEGELAALPDKLVSLYRDGVPVTGSTQFMNFFNGIRTSAPYFDLQIAMRGMKDDGVLDAEHVRRALLQAFPRFPGDHTTVVNSPELLDYLESRH
ncbi:MAG TPA: hypothetical protein VL588_05785, partial [Bdellovibrionota bacterium]|nr:hypothetical protein [Bdellovibrionota bacterium]